ncbi:MAG: TRAP transporter small permease [Spirochaetia bacterium]|jgi:TRAP-type C4-dicarboxylate transport system permease small subunit|nr:TRAP transporter small permease [Spirochaetia bacterium]
MAEKKKFYLDELLGAFFLAIMSLITFVNVVNRYLFSKSLAFSEEVVVNLFVWISLLGVSIAFRRGSHLQMTNLYDKFSPQLKRISIAVSGVIGVIIFAFLIYNSSREIYKNMTFYHSISDALGIPTWIYSLGTPVFSLFVIKEIISSTLRGIKKSTAQPTTAGNVEGGK